MASNSLGNIINAYGIKMKTFKEFLELNTEEHYPGVYMALKLSDYSDRALKEFQELDGELENLHCTLIYSDKPFIGKIEVKEYSIIVKPKKFSLFGENNDILVLEVESRELMNRNRELIQQYGFIQDWAYSPHITLVANFSGDVESLVLPSFDIILENEYLEALDKD